MFVDSIACLVQSPPLTFPKFNGKAFFSSIASFRFIELYLLTITLNIVLSERRTNFLTKTTVVRTPHSLKRSVAMGTKTIDNDAVIFFLSACCIEPLKFAVWTCSLKMRHDHFSKATGLVLSTCLWIQIPTRMKTNGHGLTRRVEV